MPTVSNWNELCNESCIAWKFSSFNSKQTYVSYCENCYEISSPSINSPTFFSFNNDRIFLSFILGHFRFVKNDILFEGGFTNASFVIRIQIIKCIKRITNVILFEWKHKPEGWENCLILSCINNNKNTNKHASLLYVWFHFFFGRMMINAINKWWNCFFFCLVFSLTFSHV